MNVATENRRWYYGVIVLACFLLSASCTGFLNNFNSLFLSTVSDALHVRRSQLALYSTFSSITTMICLPIVSKLYQKMPMRLLALLGALAGAGAHLLYSLANSVWLFYLGGILAGLCGSLACTTPINMTLSNWFQKKRGLATGIVYTGSSLISSLFSPAVSQILIRYGWRIAYRSVSAGLLVASLPFLLLIRPTPAAAGMQPYGAEKENACKQIPLNGFLQKQAITMPSYWFFGIGILLLGAVTSGTQHHLVSYWESVGLSQPNATRMYSAVLLAGVIGKLLIGALFDRFRVRPLLIFCIFLELGAFISLLLCTGRFSLLPAVLFGLTTAFQIILPAYLTQRFFGTRDYVSNMGLITTMLYLGASCGSPSSALIYDLTGGYRLAWLVFIIVSAAAFLCVLIANTLSMRDFSQRLGLHRKE